MASSGPGRFKSLSSVEGGPPTGYLLYNFDPNKADLKPEHQNDLRETLGQILASGRSQVKLVGRAARSESPGQDIGLSADRADGVARFLSSLRISPGQVTVQPLGERFGFPAANAEEDRGVLILVAVAREFVVGLRKETRVAGVKWALVEQTIRDGIGPLVAEAGRTLKFSTGAPTDDVVINFSDAPQAMLRPCEGVHILGIEGGGSVYVDAHTQMRVCGGPNPLERLFGSNDQEMARALGNTAMHELGHRIASLDHVPDPGNFVYAAPGMGANLPVPQRSREALRKHFGGKKRFSEDQRKALIEAIASGYYSGGERIR